MNTSNKREKSTLERRQLLIETAAKCFAEKGFHQTSMRDLAARAGISLGNVYNHFGSKSDLIQEIASLEADEIRQLQVILEANEDPLTTLDQFVTIYVEACAEPDSALLLAEIMCEGLRNQDIREGFLANRETLLSTLARVLQDLEGIDEATLGAPAKDCAEQVLDLIEGLALRLAFAGKSLGKKDRTRLKVGINRLIGR